MPQVSSSVTANYLRVKTGSQLGTPELQALLIKTYNEDWGTLTTDSSTGNPNILVSNGDTTFAKIVRAVQDYAEIYFIGQPQVGAGGENNVTECVIWVNVNTNSSGGELRSTGRWTALEAHIQASIPTTETTLVYFAVPDGWIWKAQGIVNQGNRGDGYFPII